MNKRELRSRLSAFLMHWAVRVAPTDVRAYLLGGPLDGALVHAAKETEMLPVQFGVLGPFGMPVAQEALYSKTGMMRGGMQVYVYAGRDFEEEAEPELPV